MAKIFFKREMTFGVDDGLRGKTYYMNTLGINHFNQIMRDRTKAFAVGMFLMLQSSKFNDLSRIPAKQILRSSSSVAANFWSAARGRSEAEFYSKICIVVEACDETLFWFDFMIATNLLDPENSEKLYKETEELLAIFSTIKRKLRYKREHP